MFAIEFIGDPRVEFGEPARLGRVTLDDFSEEFAAPLVFWAAGDYQKEWVEAAERIVNGQPRSCFVAAMRELPLTGPVFLWPAYRDGEVVYVRHKLLLPVTVKGGFDPSNPYAQVDERRTLPDDGEPVSEWRVSVGDIARFLRAG
jgi:hypothetical protein